MLPLKDIVHSRSFPLVNWTLSEEICRQTNILSKASEILGVAQVVP